MVSAVKPAIKVEPLEALDPTLEAGSAHSATARLTNPTTKEFTYTTELYLGVTKAATSGPGTVTIGPGASVDMTYPIIMPIAEGEYEVYIDVWVGAELIAHYKATENVVISVSPAIDIGDIIWT